MKDKQPGEVYSMCEGYRPVADANKLLKPFGLVIRKRGSYAEMGDAVYLRIELLGAGPVDLLGLFKAIKRVRDAYHGFGPVDDGRPEGDEFEASLDNLIATAIECGAKMTD